MCRHDEESTDTVRCSPVTSIRLAASSCFRQGVRRWQFVRGLNPMQGGGKKTGPVPSSRPGSGGDLVALGSLRLDGNDLSGPIPPEIGKLTALEWLNLSYNALTGQRLQLHQGAPFQARGRSKSPVRCGRAASACPPSLGWGGFHWNSISGARLRRRGQADSAGVRGRLPDHRTHGRRRLRSSRWLSTCLR